MSEYRKDTDEIDAINISVKKIIDNIKKYWWICFITTVVSLILIVGITVMKNRSLNSVEEVDLLNDEDVIFEATSMMYLLQEDVDLFGGYTTDTALDVFAQSYSEYAKAYIEQWNWSKNNALMNDLNSILSSNKVITQIDKKLQKQKFDPYDIVLDQISMNVKNSSSFYTLTVYGKDKNRTKYIADTATEILLKEAEEFLGATNTKIIDNAVIYTTKKNGDGMYKRITGGSVMASNLKPDESLNLGSFITKKNILLGGAGVFSGLFIILIFILLDKKIRRKEDVSLFFNLSYIGGIHQSVDDVLATAIVCKCKNEGTRSLLVTSPEHNSKGYTLVDKIAECYSDDVAIYTVEENKKQQFSINAEKKLTIIYADNINSSSEAVKYAGKVDQVLMILTSNHDEVPGIDMAINYIETVGGKIFGYVLNK